MDNFQKDIDDRANLTLSNRFELLLFRLGTSLDATKSELFGINVFKLREIVPMPTFTRPAGMKPPLMGMVNIRDQVIPVIDLSAVAGCKPETGLNILLITEYARSVQAFAVESVENITRLDWKQVHTAEKAINGRYITSIACLDDDKDKGLNAMEIPSMMHITGKDAWEKIQLIAQQAEKEGVPVSDKISMVLTDLEMPEMDGFTLTRLIKTDPRLKNIPVVIHSSLSGSANEDHVRKVQADGYVAKFEINELSAVIQEVLDRAANNVRGPLISHRQMAPTPLLAK